MSWLKKIFRITQPGIGSKILGEKANEKDAYNAGAASVTAPGPDYEAQLKAEEGLYGGLPQQIHDTVLANSQTAGTYANTPEFLRGLDSEQEAELRGADASSIARQNSLRRLLKLTDLDPSTTRQTPVMFTQQPAGAPVAAVPPPGGASAVKDAGRPPRPPQPQQDAQQSPLPQDRTRIKPDQNRSAIPGMQPPDRMKAMRRKIGQGLPNQPSAPLMTTNV